MSVSTNAYLIFGIDFGDFDEDPPSVFTSDEDTGDDPPVYKELEGTPLEWVTHCSHDYPMHIVGFRKAHLRAHRGYPTEFKELPLTDKLDISLLKEFCKLHSLKYKEPTWILCSDWS